MVLVACAAGISASSASTTPQRMPTSRLPRSDWLGSSTSPPLINRSNLSFGPMAAMAFLDSAAAAADPVKERKWRRDNPDILGAPSHMIFYGWMMRSPHAFRKQRRTFALLFACRIEMLGWPANKEIVLANGERTFQPAGAGLCAFGHARRSGVRRNHRGDREQMGPDRPVVARL